MNGPDKQVAVGSITPTTPIFIVPAVDKTDALLALSRPYKNIEEE